MSVKSILGARRGTWVGWGPGRKETISRQITGTGRGDEAVGGEGREKDSMVIVTEASKGVTTGIKTQLLF